MSSKEPDVWFRFVRAHRTVIREIERRLAAADLPPYAWYDALWGLESGPEGTRRMHELADVLAIERYNLTRLVDRLEKTAWWCAPAPTATAVPRCHDHRSRPGVAQKDVGHLRKHGR